MDSSRRLSSSTNRQPIEGSRGSHRTGSTRHTRLGSDHSHRSNDRDARMYTTYDPRTTGLRIDRNNNKQAISQQPTTSYNGAQSTSATAGNQRSFANHSRSNGADQSTSRSSGDPTTTAGNRKSFALVGGASPSSGNHQPSSSSSLNRSRSFSDFYGHRNNINRDSTGASEKSVAAESIRRTVAVSHASGAPTTAGDRKSFDLFGINAVQISSSSHSYDQPTTSTAARTRNCKSFALFDTSDIDQSSSQQHQPPSSSSSLSSNQPSTSSNFNTRNFAGKSLVSRESVSCSSGKPTSAGNDRRTLALFGGDTDRDRSTSSSSSRNLPPSSSSLSANRLYRK